MAKTSRIQEALRLWANWAGHRVGTEIYNVSPAFREAVTYRNHRSINDCEAMVIDNAVGLLKRYDSDNYELIRSFYLKRRSGSYIAQQLDASRSAVNTRLRVAESFLAGVLASHCSTMD